MNNAQNAISWLLQINKHVFYHYYSQRKLFSVRAGDPISVSTSRGENISQERIQPELKNLSCNTKEKQVSFLQNSEAKF